MGKSFPDGGGGMRGGEEGDSCKDSLQNDVQTRKCLVDLGIIGSNRHVWLEHGV